MMARPKRRTRSRRGWTKAERDLQAAQKAIKDTQRWGHKNAEEVKRLKKEAEDRKRRETLADDPVLKANPGLEDAIEHVAGKREDDDAKPAPQEQWLSSVAKAIPDVETLLADQAFFAKAKAKQAEYGPEWDDPFVAIRELSELKVQLTFPRNASRRRRAGAQGLRDEGQEAQRDGDAWRLRAGRTVRPDQRSGAYRTMSKEDFDKVRSRSWATSRKREGTAERQGQSDNGASCPFMET
jgi:hypothetical protein